MWSVLVRLPRGTEIEIDDGSIVTIYSYSRDLRCYYTNFGWWGEDQAHAAMQRQQEDEHLNPWARKVK